MSDQEKCPREELEAREKTALQERAALSTDPKYARRQFALRSDQFRTQFHRDYTRIIHCRAFRRLRHKTQVFISPQNDHLCTRLEHSLHVASVATTIARALKLNQDLVAAIAVGHDLGHAPFGHAGEKVLNDIAKDHELQFSHESQSLRVVDVLESPYRGHPGLNLTFAVRDGIVCHYGEGFEPNLQPDRGKTPSTLRNTERGKSRPATLEGCVVRWADKVAYLGRDLEDALTLRLVKRREIPSKVRNRLGITNRRIIASLVEELVHNGTGGDRLCVRKRIHAALNDLYKFNMRRIYQSGAATQDQHKLEPAMRLMFERLLDEYNTGDWQRWKPSSRRSSSVDCLYIFGEFLKKDLRKMDKTKDLGPQLVLDFIAGMTDSFFIRSFTDLCLPQGTV